MEIKQGSFEFLREWLPTNWAAIIADKHGVSDRFVRMVLRGERDSQTALEVAASIVELAGAHKKKIMEIREKAQQI